MGVEVEKMNWMRGNISFLFHVSEASSQFIILDHDRRLYEEVDKMKDFTDAEVEDDVNVRLNTQIYSGRVHRPRDGDGARRVKFVRQQGGLFGLGGDRDEQIGPYKTQVYDIPDVEVFAKYRKEHLKARERQGQSEETVNGNAARPINSDEILAEIHDVQPKMENMIAEARKTLYSFVPSLPPPNNVPAVTFDEYFSASKPYIHVGRRLMQTEKFKKFKVSVWMADNFPLTVQQLLPFIEVIAMGNRNFEKVQEFISMELPSGFPVRIEIPLFAFLAAQITFLNFQFWQDKQQWSRKIPRPAFADASQDWFEVPADYKAGIVIKNILKDN